MVTTSDPAAATLREVVSELATLSRRAGSEGEHRAAEWLAHRLRTAGVAADVQETHFHAGYAGLMRGLTLASAAAGLTALLARRSHVARGIAGAVAGGAALALADDVSNGPRIVRTLLQRTEATWNVIGTAGDPEAARTLVVLAHHDAAPTGAIFDDRPQRWVGERFPGLIERTDTSVPLWWGPLAAQGLVTVGALGDRPRLTAAGLLGCAASAAAFHDIACSDVTPGANDNLTAVAVLVALAERLEAEPLVPGLRVLLVSCGAEEVLQGGIHGFAREWFGRLDPERTWFLNLDTVGSPRLALLEGEGPVAMEDYPDHSFRDLIARRAADGGIALMRGLRARSSTDSVVPARAGYPTATLTSIDANKALSNYHLMSDTPERVDYRTVASALELCESVARELATA